MGNYTNAQILAAVLSDWARPAISQIATQKLGSIKAVQSMQQSLVNTGLVGSGYQVANELLPFIHNGIDTLIQPILTNYLSKMDDATLPAIAHSVVDTAMQQPKFSILDGLVTFEQEDMLELKDLLDKNLPLKEKQNYSVIK